MNKEKNFISAVVYVRNNEQNILKFAENLNNILEQNFLKYEIIFVNDESTDKSEECINKFANKVRGGVYYIN